MATGNPALSESAFETASESSAMSGSGDAVMTIDGTVGKTFILLALVLASAMWTWQIYATTQSTAAVMPYMIGGTVGGFIVALITIFKKTVAPITAPIYSILEGLAMGAISAFFEAQYPGIVIHAVGFSVCICAAMLMLYTSRAIKVTQNFVMGVAAATMGVALFYVLTFVLSLFHIQVPMIYGSGIVGIGFSLFVVGLASLNLVLDFNVIENGAQMKAPKYMEWYGAFGLMVTLVWLYVEVLRLASKLRGGNR